MLVYLMCGYTLQGLDKAIRSGVWGGVHPKLTVEVLKKFKKEHGTHLDIIGQTINRDQSIGFGQRALPSKPVKVGQ